MFVMSPSLFLLTLFSLPLVPDAAGPPPSQVTVSRFDQIKDRIYTKAMRSVPVSGEQAQRKKECFKLCKSEPGCGALYEMDGLCHLVAEEIAATNTYLAMDGVASYRLIPRDMFYKTNINYGASCPESHPYSYKLGHACCKSTVASCATGAMEQGLGFESEVCYDGNIRCSKVPCYNNNKTMYNVTKGSRWRLVRHVTQGSNWHNATDQLRGTDVYGDPAMGLGTEFSLKYDTDDYNQFMFSTGNCKHWLIVNKDDVIGPDGEKYYGNKLISIVASSISGEPYSAQWYRRKGTLEDPWVSVRNHSDPAGNIMLYGQNNKEGHVKTLKSNGGASVFIRNL